MTVDGDNLYWGDTFAHTVEVVSISTSERRILAAETHSPFGMVHDGENLYVSVGNSYEILRFALPNGEPIELASDMGNPWSIAVDATSAYWTSFVAGRIMATAK